MNTGDANRYHICTTGCQHPCRFKGRLIQSILGFGSVRVDELSVNARDIKLPLPTEEEES